MKEDNKKSIYWTVIAVLVIIIIILLFLSRCGKKDLTPTGNVDVFNIDINDCGDTGKCENDKDNTGDNDKKNSKYPSWGDYVEHELNKIYVDDEEGNYVYHHNLRIFKNPYFEFEDKIAPGVSNSYAFVVHNNSEINVRYYVEMYKECNYNLDIRYRLKRNGKYVIGNDSKWVGAEELKTAFKNLNKGQDDRYVLDWKWDYESGKDDVDTYIGENMEDVYKLNVKFHFEQI